MKECGGEGTRESDGVLSFYIVTTRAGRREGRPSQRGGENRPPRGRREKEKKGM